MAAGIVVSQETWVELAETLHPVRPPTTEGVRRRTDLSKFSGSWLFKHHISAHDNDGGEQSDA